ncbi:aromatic ring-hydroxylating dioxygenase subunit alpha [Sulfolobus sp. S-194]|uniref:aromatic ring-hydroxylating oxygenase subunit alpha n=1 Tax=Sulfolobus sp. S-194 TaxID=2512240 RepID=UPI00143710D8|nr:aromatic ring-hydroxylating dioxygenase subunit alpha [Sulfolobus sp. S-194]QIW22874.1 aromatic ring-hydroxylating dioxygenase subunit alpha [Sulfolobus sp. S-194]
MSLNVLLRKVKESFSSNNYEIPLKLINDYNIYEMELEKVFSRSWIFLGFTEEIPNEGDYMVRYIGPDPFIVIRGDDGKIRAFFNSCRHRGSIICTNEYGNTNKFTCPYHGWSYDIRGRLIGVPLRDKIYKNLDMNKWGLLEIYVQFYENLIFASINPEVELYDYLGEARYYLDIIFKLTGGMKPVNVPIRFIADFNWKIGAENFSEDRLHTLTTHKSVVDFGLASPISRFGYISPGKDEVSIADLKTVSGKFIGAFGFRFAPGEHIRGYFGFNINSSSLKDDPRIDVLKRVSHTVFTIFPNLSGFISADSTDDPTSTKPRYPVSLLRLWNPIAPDKTEVWTWVIVPRETSDEIAKRVYEITLSHFGPSGAAEEDDVSIWRGITKVAGGYFSRHAVTNLKAGSEKDLPRLENWNGPGIVRPTQFHEECQRTFWKAWIERMVEE